MSTSPIIYTYWDAIDDLLDFLGGVNDENSIRMAKSAILTAYRELASARAWTYYLNRSRITTKASYDTGTITYTDSTRTVTLASGTWPSWAANGVLIVDNVAYQVITRTSDSVLVLSTNSNPSDDLAAGTEYTLVQQEYTIPVDMLSAGNLMDVSNRSAPDYVLASEWLQDFSMSLSPAQPRVYTLKRDARRYGMLSIAFSPPPDAEYNYDFIYRRHPRQIKIAQYNTGTVSSSGTTITGSSAVAFTSDMVGAIIRFSSSSTAVTGLTGLNPYVEYRTITARPTSTTLTIDAALTNELTSVAYEISDPIDLEQSAMYSAFMRKAELELAKKRHRDDLPRIDAAYKEALVSACEADSRSFSDKPGTPLWRVRLKDMPFTLD